MILSLSTVAICATCALGAPSVTDKDVKNAINMITTALEERHDELRCWDPVIQSKGWLHRHPGTTTALTTLSLLSAGVSYNSPKIQRAIDFIWEIEEPSSYLRALRISIWAVLPDTFERRLEKDTKQLLRSMSLELGGWSVIGTPTKNEIVSPLIREFGVIALRDAHNRGITISKKYWLSIANAALKAQHADGGWAYSSSGTAGKSSSNMTVAGLNCLLGIDESCGRDLNTYDADKLHLAIEQALTWLDEHGTIKNSGGTALMSYLYALERVAMACGLSEVRSRDWYVDGCKSTFKAHCGKKKAKGSTVNLAFALLFLSRGNSPIAMSELVERKSNIDMYKVSDAITKKVSHKVETELSWRLLTQEESISSWLLSPFMLIQNHEVVQDIQKFQQYLQHGGMIVMLATGKSLQTCRNLAETICPDIEMEHYQRNHWGHNLLETADNVHFWVWNDNVRDRILVIQGDGEKLTRSSNSALARALVNICCGTIEIDQWKTRLHVTQTFKPLRKMILAKHSGNWDSEVAAYRTWRTEEKEFSEITKPSLVWVGGIDEDEITEVLISNIIETAKKGSTIIIESIGGRGHFAKKACEQIASATNATPTPLQLPFVPTGRGWTILHRESLPVPLAITVGKGKIISIDCDIRNALLHQTTWGVHGYSYESAKKLTQQLCN